MLCIDIGLMVNVRTPSGSNTTQEEALVLSLGMIVSGFSLSPGDEE